MIVDQRLTVGFNNTQATPNQTHNFVVQSTEEPTPPPPAPLPSWWWILPTVFVAGAGVYFLTKKK